MATYSAIITCMTEVEVSVQADNADQALALIEAGAVTNARLHDGGLDMCERMVGVVVVPESFGEDN